MIAFAHTLPDDNRALRQALYQGTLFHLPGGPAARRLCADVLALLEEALGREPRTAQFRFSDEEFFQRIGGLRRQLYTAPRFHQAVRDVIAGCGFAPGENGFDPLRLRVVAHRGFENPSAAPVYYPHRDTWYAHPQCQITWWLALHDADEEETFVFYPERFAQPVANGSGDFDYDAWTRDGWGLKIGWQDIRAGRTASYPSVIGPIEPGPALGFSCRAGDLLLFSGAHFHKTRENLTGRTRFSLDFRTAHLADHAQGLGAPNADNRSRGCAIIDYVR
jgi:hypothetical protein